MRDVEIIGVASGRGARDSRCEDGPQTLQASGILQCLSKSGQTSPAFDVLHVSDFLQNRDDLAQVAEIDSRLALLVAAKLKNHILPLVVGGDHACAVGTWSGVRAALPPQQELYLDKMDQKMDAGIFVGDATIPNPDINQRAQFVAGNLAHAILSDDEAMCSALTAYLASRLPELKQVKITNNKTENNTADEASDAVSIELVFDEEYQKQVAVKFLH